MGLTIGQSLFYLTDKFTRLCEGSRRLSSANVAISVRTKIGRVYLSRTSAIR
jgi:hypothetical protein